MADRPLKAERVQTWCWPYRPHAPTARQHLGGRGAISVVMVCAWWWWLGGGGGAGCVELTGISVPATQRPRPLAEGSATWARPSGHIFPNVGTPRRQGSCSHSSFPPDGRSLGCCLRLRRSRGNEEDRMVPRGAFEGKGPQRRPQKRLDRRLEEVAEAVGGGYCRLQMPLKLALAVRLGIGWAPWRGSPLPMHLWGCPGQRDQDECPWPRANRVQGTRCWGRDVKDKRGDCRGVGHGVGTGCYFASRSGCLRPAHVPTGLGVGHSHLVTWCVGPLPLSWGRSLPGAPRPPLRWHHPVLCSAMLFHPSAVCLK